jgi:protein O-mannosyl-transferase
LKTAIPPLVLAALLVLITLAAFWPLHQNDFINYDDQQYLTENPNVQSGLSPQGLRWAFTTSHASNWHPLTWISHMIDCQLFGLKPAGHHLVSLALHIANTLLLFALLFQMTAAPMRSAIVAAIFAVHPLHVESVAWASERKDVLSTFFGLLALIAYARYAVLRKIIALKVDSHAPVPKWFASQGVAYAASLISFALGLMSKPMLVTLPLLLLLLDLWPLRRVEHLSPRTWFAANRRLWIEKAPFLLLSAASCAVTTAVQTKAMVYYQALPFGYRIQNALVSYGRYLGKTFWPHNLSIIYPHPGIWPATEVVGAGVLLALLSLLAIVARKKAPYMFVGWFWFLGLLVPVIGLIQVGVQAMADRYTYLPLVGISVACVWGVADFANAKQWPLWARTALASVLVVALAWQTRLEVGYWKSTETIFSHAIDSTPGNWVAHHNLALLGLSRYQQTQRSGIGNELLDSRSLVSSTNHDYLADVINHCDAALAAKPGLAELHATLAKALTEKGDLERAQQHLLLLVSLTPTNAQAHQNLAEIFLRQGKPKDAIREYKTALAIDPGWAPVMNNLAWLLATRPEAELRDGGVALKLANDANKLNGSTNLWFLHTLAAAYAETADFSNAVLTAEQALAAARATGQSNLISTADHRVNLYRAGAPLRDP